jgi:hypothetical protein
VFINQTNCEVEIPAGTVGSTGAGAPITSAPRRTRRCAGVAAVEANEALPDSSGDVGNVASGLIIRLLPLESSVTVRNIAATVGGESRTVPRSRSKTRAPAGDRPPAASVQAYLAMLQQLSPSQMLIVRRCASRKSEDWTNSARPSDVTDTFR